MSAAATSRSGDPAGTAELSDHPKPRRRRRRRWILRILSAVALLSVAAVVAAWVWIESSAGQERLRQLLEQRSSATLGRQVTVASLDFDLLPFVANLSGIEVAGGPAADQPLVRADRIEIRIRMWALLSRQVVVRSLEIESPVVHWDLPADSPGAIGAFAGEEPGYGLEVERLVVSNGSLEIGHSRWALDTSLADLEVGLQPIDDLVGLAPRRSGFVRVGAGSLRVNRATEEAPASGGSLEIEGAELLLTLEESAMQIDRARITAGDSELTASGQINEWREGQIDVDGSFALADIVELLGISIGEHGGEARLDGNLTFGNEPLRFSGALVSDSLVGAGLEVTDVRARLEVTRDRVSVQDLGARFFDGTIEASVEVDLASDPAALRLEYEGSGVNLARLTASPGMRGFRFAGIAGASGTLSWQDPWRETLSGNGNLSLSLPPGTLADLSPLPTAPPTEAQDPGTRVPGRPLPDPVAGGGEQARPTPSLPLPLEAEAEFELDGGALTLRRAVASLPRTEATLTGSVDLDGVLAAEFDLTSTDLRMLDRFFSQVRRFRGEQPVPQPLGLTGSGRVVASVGGRTDAPTVEGTVAGGAITIADIPIGDIDGSLRLAGSSLEILDLRVRRGEGQAAGDGHFRIGARAGSGPDYRFGVRLESYPMEVTLPRLGVPMSIAGEASGELALVGDYGEPPSGSVELRGDAVRLNDLGDLSADVLLRLEAAEWVAERFELDGPRGRVSATGTWQRADDSVQASLDGVGIEASALGDVMGSELSLGGSLDLQARLTGVFSDLDAAAVLHWTGAEMLGVSIGSVASSAELRSGALALSAVGRTDPGAPAIPPPTPSAAGGAVPVPIPPVPASGWAATLSTDLSEPYTASFRAAGEPRLVLAALAAQGYEPGEDLDVQGSFEVEGSGPLPDWKAWSGTATLGDFSLARPGLAFSIPDPVTLRLDAEVLRIELPRLLSDAGTLVAEAAIDIVEGRWLEADASGSLSLEVLEMLSDDWEFGGRIDIELQASGELTGSDVTGSFDLYDVRLRNPEWPWFAENLRGSVRLADNRLQLVDVAGISAGSSFRADGEFPLAALAGDESSAPGRLNVHVDELPLQPVWEKTGRLQQLLTGGATTASLSVQGFGSDWRAYRGSIDVEALTVQLADLQLRMPAPTSLVVGDGRVGFPNPIVLRGPGTNLEVGGAFLLGPFRLDTTLRGVAALDPLNAVTGSWGISGRADIDARVSGDPPELTYDGTVTVSSALLNAPVLQPVDNIFAVLTLDSRLVRIDSFTGTLGSGRSRGDANVTGSGEVQLLNSVPQRFVLNLSVDEAQLRLQRGIRATASADLIHEGTFESSTLSGTVIVSEADYTQRWESEADLLELSSTEVAGIEHELAGTVNLDLEVRAPGDVRLLNNMADVELSADLEVRGTLADPVVLGSATVLDGDVTLRDHRYRFLRGSVEFQNPMRTEPHFDFLAETSIRQYLVTIGVSGSPDRGDLQATFASSPPLSDLQLIQLLTVGDAPDDATRRETDDETIGAVGAQATSFLTRQYMSQVERGAQRVFGVDRFRVEPAVVEGSGDPTARVTLGKQVTPDLWISWTSVLGTTEEQLVRIEYQLTRGIRVTATREEDGSLGVDFRFDHRFR